MNTVDRTTLKDKIVEARKAQLRVRRMYKQNDDYDLGALYSCLFEYIGAVGFGAPALKGVYLSPKTFDTWLADLDKWFLTVADLYYVTLPEEE